MRKLLLALVSSGIGASAMSAQLYVQPIMTVGAEYDSNLDMDPTSHSYNYGYLLDAATLFGIATPTTDTNIEPRLRYDDYPRESSLNRLEGMLDFNTSYTSPRSNFFIFGRYVHLNEDEAEEPSALYSNINPAAPTAPATGEVNIGVTQDNIYIVPKYSYELTQLVSVGASAVLQNLTYSVTNPVGLVNFNYEQLELFLERDFTQRASITFGGYGTRYEATSITSNAKSGGATMAFDYSWSKLAHGELSVQYQHTDVQTTQPTFDAAANTLGASLSGVWKQRTSQVRLNIGRFVTPSGGGGLYLYEQAQAEYDRSLSERLSYSAAVLGIHSRGLTANISTFDQNYLQGVLSLRWMLTRTWFVQAGGSYTNLKYATEPTGAANDQAYVRFGYQGLSRQ